MSRARRHLIRLMLYRYAMLFLLLAAAGPALAGGGPHQVLIVMNSRSRESLEIGNFYRRARDIPYRQTLALSTSTAPAISYQTYLNEIETPIRSYLREQRLEEDITTLVLTRGLPVQVDVQNGRATASLLAAMGLGKGSARITNPYQGFPLAFSRRQDTLTGMYLVTVLNGYHVDDIKTLIAQGAQADGTAPDGRFILQAVPQMPRASSSAAADLLTQRGLRVEVVDTPPDDRTGLMSYFSGGIYSGLTADLLGDASFRAGALVDLAQGFSATAKNFDDSEPAVLLPASAFVRSGATGVHGVVGEAGMGTFPMIANLKLLLDRYTSGFSLAESVYAALPALNWQNVLLGDPLTAPYARRPVVTLEIGEEVQGTAECRVSAAAQAPGATITRMHLYLDDRFLTTIYQPTEAQISLRVGERVVQYTLPAGATLQQLLNELAARINVDPVLAADGGVRAVPQVHRGVLQLVSRSAGEDGNGVPVAINITGNGDQPTLVTARVGRGVLSGGGVGPTPARGTVSFVGRKMLPGDHIDVQIQNEHILYDVPAAVPTLPALLDELVARIQAVKSLQRRNGVRAYRDPDGMPFLTLEARTPGDAGNQIFYQSTVKPVAGSQLKGYPDTPSLFSGGQDGSTATLDIGFALGDATPSVTVQLDTTPYCDGAHRLRAVAADGTPAQVQGWTTRTLIIRNLPDLPGVSLPARLGPAVGAVEAPVTAGEGITRVEFFIDGQPRGEATEAPFTARLALDDLGQGAHDLWAEGVDAAGRRTRSRVCVLEVRTPPDVFRIDPPFSLLAGGETHRIAGTGFQPECRVRLNGVPAKSVKRISPTLLEVVGDAGPAGRGGIEVSNPDGQSATLPEAFEYYRPRVATVKVRPSRDVIAPGSTVRFQAISLDQFGRPFDLPLSWEALGGGAITAAGDYTAPREPGRAYLVRAVSADGREAARAQVTVGTEELSREGWLRQWLVLGAFPDPDYTALLTPLIDEPTVEPSHGDTAGELAWRSVNSENNFVDFASVLAPNTHAAAYAHVYLNVPATTAASLIFGANDGVRIWVNGELVFTQRIRRAAVDSDQNTVGITLHEGWNRLLVKVDQESGAWGFYLRLRAKGGKALNDVRFALDKPIDKVP